MSGSLVLLLESLVTGRTGNLKPSFVGALFFSFFELETDELPSGLRERTPFREGTFASVSIAHRTPSSWRTFSFF